VGAAGSELPARRHAVTVAGATVACVHANFEEEHEIHIEAREPEATERYRKLRRNQGGRG